MQRWAHTLIRFRLFRTNSGWTNFAELRNAETLGGGADLCG